MMLLGLDLASRLTGWCAGDGTSIPACGAWEFERVDGDYGWLLDQLDQHLQVSIDRFKPEAVAYEAPILIARGRGGAIVGDTLSKLRLLYPLGAHVEFVCRRRGIQCFEVGVKAIKKEITGNAHAEKGDMVAIAKKCGLKLPIKSRGEDDAADAFGAWMILLRHFNPALSDHWTKRIYSPRGALI